MIRLGKRSRRVLTLLGAGLTICSFAAFPLVGIPDARNHDLVSVPRDAALTPLTDGYSRLPRVDDPFERPLPANPPLTPRAMPRLARQETVRVRAIVGGATVLALIEDGGTRVVRVGDRVDGARVVAIDSEAVVLSDRRRIGVDEAAR